LSTTEKNLALLKELVATKEGLFESTKTVSESELKRNRIQFNQAEGEYKALKEIKKREEIEYRISQQVLSNYSLTSPIKGQVIDIHQEVGEWVKVGDPIIRIIDSSVCYLDINLDANQALSINKDKPVKIQIPTATNPIAKTGKIQYIAPIADGGSGLVRLKIYFDNTEPKIIPGVTGRLILE
jgi:membrane fusion protein (multidrug efflux system)